MICMNGIQNIKHRLGRAGLGGIMILLSLYFAIHAFEGNSGLKALKGLQLQHGELAVTAGHMSEERALLEKRVSLLRDKTVDPDMLEEQARKSLGYSHADDITVFVR